MQSNLNILSFTNIPDHIKDPITNFLNSDHPSVGESIATLGKIIRSRECIHFIDCCSFYKTFRTIEMAPVHRTMINKLVARVLFGVKEPLDLDRILETDIPAEVVDSVYQVVSPF